MTSIKPFGPNCTLGEGSLWHPLIERLFWFDIPRGDLHSSDSLGGQIKSWNFGEPASAAGWIDEDTLLVATATGLQKFDLTLGTWEKVCALEEDNIATRSNDGRIGPDGSFWIGTMARDGSPHLGGYYRYVNGSIETLQERISIPNATCFSPDGKVAYYADTRKQVIWQWPLDAQGNPIGDKEIHINMRDDNINPDGAVCDAEGYLWNAQWGASRIVRYDPDGRLDKSIELPVSQPTCPAFGGPDLKTLFITSASDGLSDSQLQLQPNAGKTLMFSVDIPGIAENRANV